MHVASSIQYVYFVKSVHEADDKDSDNSMLADLYEAKVEEFKVLENLRILNGSSQSRDSCWALKQPANPCLADNSQSRGSCWALKQPANPCLGAIARAEVAAGH